MAFYCSCCIIFFIIYLIIIIRRNEKLERKKKELERRRAIKSYLGEWGVDICKAVYMRKVMLDMNQDMVLMSWGKPIEIDQKSINSKSVKERWVYGIKRKNASYVYFSNGKVTKIQS